MKKKIVLLALCVLLISGCGKKIPTLSNGDEAVVTFKDGTMISVNELYTAVKDDYALQALINLVDKKILEEKYSDKIEETKKSVETSMEQLEAAYGDSLLQALQQNGFSSEEAYKEALYVNFLQNLAVEDYCKGKITDKEIEKYYEDEIVGDIKVSHILITADVTDDMTDEEKEAKENEAKEKIESIIDELNKTSKDKVADKFAELAKEYSMDETTKNNGGSFGFINKDTLSDQYDELVKAAYKLKDGTYSTDVITTEIGYHVILRTETKEKAALDEVKDTIVETLANEYLSSHSVAIVESMQELRKEYKMEIVDSEIQSQYATYIQNSLTQYQQADQESANSTN